MPQAPVILITGAARRVGAAIARALHARGASLMLHYRRSEVAARELAAELNALRPESAAVWGADLGDKALLETLVAATLQRFGCLDALINNASSFYATPFGAIDEAAWDDLIGSNLKGPMFLSQAAAPALKTARGCIVNITDIHAERPLAGYAPYVAAKAGLLGLSRALAVELAPEVRVNAVAPGAIAWPDDDSFDSAARSAIIDSVPLGREGRPDDIARTGSFLVFDAPYITGQVINVDGGRTTHLDHGRKR